MDKEKFKQKMLEAGKWIKIQIKKFAEWLKKVAQAFARWCVEHEDMVRKYAPMLVGICALAAKEGIRRAREDREYNKKACGHYDRRTAEWVWSTRKLTNSEAKILNRLYAEGYSKREILESLGLLRD